MKKILKVCKTCGKTFETEFSWRDVCLDHIPNYSVDEGIDEWVFK
jgi:hypothetical protein